MKKTELLDDYFVFIIISFEVPTCGIIINNNNNNSNKVKKYPLSLPKRSICT